MAPSKVLALQLQLLATCCFVCYTAAECVRTDDVDYPGNDAMRSSVNTPNACADLCKSTEGCTHATAAPLWAGRYYCWRKTGTPNAAAWEKRGRVSFDCTPLAPAPGNTTMYKRITSGVSHMGTQVPQGGGDTPVLIGKPRPAQGNGLARRVAPAEAATHACAGAPAVPPAHFQAAHQSTRAHRPPPQPPLPTPSSGRAPDCTVRRVGCGLGGEV